MTAEIGCDDSVAGGEEEGDLEDPVVGIAGPAVEEEDGWGGGGAAVCVEDCRGVGGEEGHGAEWLG